MLSENDLLHLFHHTKWQPRNPGELSVTACRPTNQKEAYTWKSYELTLATGSRCLLRYYPVSGLLACLPGQKSRARIQYERLLELERAGIAVAHPVAWGLGTGGSFLLLELAPGLESAADVWAQMNRTLSEREAFICAFIRLIGHLYTVNVTHPALSLDCLGCIRSADGEYKFYFVDSGEAQIKRSLSLAEKQALLESLRGILS